VLQYERCEWRTEGDLDVGCTAVDLALPCERIAGCANATTREIVLTVFCFTELYADESPALKVDPVFVLVLSVGFIISVVALHSMSLVHSLRPFLQRNRDWKADKLLSLFCSHRQGLQEIFVVR